MKNKLPARIASILENKLKAFKSRYWWFTHKSLFPACGSNVTIHLPTNLTCQNIHLGNNISIGPGAIFWAIHSKIVIGDKVVFGPDVVIMGGDHDISQLGRFMIDITDEDKNTSNDKDILFEEDIWVGTRAIILRGVTIGRGAVISAGALVNQNAPPYSIMAGIPARPVRLRWTVEQIINHEKMLYSPSKQLPRNVLESTLNKIVDKKSSL